MTVKSYKSINPMNHSSDILPAVVDARNASRDTAVVETLYQIKRRMLKCS